MRVGTRSLLFGAHQFLLHPVMVAFAWWRLYGFPTEWQMWLSFLVHDWGYWGKPNMDGEEGQSHRLLGARIVWWICDSYTWRSFSTHYEWAIKSKAYGRWAVFTGMHSRWLAKQLGGCPSKLCWADKYVVPMTPWWVYLPMARATGELAEYRQQCMLREHGLERFPDLRRPEATDREWYAELQRFMAVEVSRGSGINVVDTAGPMYRGSWLDSVGFGLATLFLACILLGAVAGMLWARGSL